jgi:hypothetical protein
MSPQAEFELEAFEQVQATSSAALLRLAGRWRSASRERLTPPLLLIDDGRRTHRVAALPGPDDVAPLATPDGPRWRAAYSARLELLSRPGTAFALDLGGDSIVDLPRPTRRAVEAEAPPAPRAPAGAPARVEAPGAAGEVARLGAELERVTADLEQERARRAAAEQAGEARRQAMVELELHLQHERAARQEADERARREGQVRERAADERARREEESRVQAETAGRARTSAARVAAVPRQRPARRRAESRWLPSETIVGLVLLALGLTAATLLLFGVVRLVIAP